MIGSEGGTTWKKGIVIYDSNYQLLKTYDFANYLEDPSYIEVDSNNRIFILDRLLNSAQKSRIVVMSTKYQ